MPAFSPVIINDGKATPVAHTFDLASSAGGRVKLLNRAATMLAAQENLVIELKQPSNGNGAYRVSLSLGAPVTVTDAGGKTTIDHVNSVAVQFNWSQSSSLAERKDVYALLKNALANALITEVIQDVEPIYT